MVRSGLVDRLLSVYGAGWMGLSKVPLVLLTFLPLAGATRPLGRPVHPHRGPPLNLPLEGGGKVAEGEGIVLIDEGFVGAGGYVVGV